MRSVKLKNTKNESLDSYHTRFPRNSLKLSHLPISIKRVRIRLSLVVFRTNYAVALKELLDAGRARERSEEQARNVEKQKLDLSDINAVKIGKTKHTPSYIDSTKRQYAQQTKPTTKCPNCGSNWPHTGDCPEKGKECRSSRETGHFAKICRSTTEPTSPRQKVCNLAETPADPDYIFVVSNNRICEINLWNHHWKRACINNYKPWSFC